MVLHKANHNIINPNSLSLEVSHFFCRNAVVRRARVGCYKHAPIQRSKIKYKIRLLMYKLSDDNAPISLKQLYKCNKDIHSLHETGTTFFLSVLPVKQKY